MAPPKMKIFPKLSNNGIVLFWMNLFVLLDLEDHWINSMKILDTANDHINIKIDFNMLLNEKSMESGKDIISRDEERPKKKTV